MTFGIECKLGTSSALTSESVFYFDISNAHTIIYRFPLFDALKDIPTRKIILSQEHSRSGGSDNIARSTLSILPREIIDAIVDMLDDTKAALELASTCKYMRGLVIPKLDQIALEEIHVFHQWMLPASVNEKLRWQELFSEARADERSNFPWYSYMKQCLGRYCWSMINRKRVHANATLICKDLINKSS